MKQLRNAIMRAFIVYFLGLSIVGDVTNELITELDSWVFGAEYQVITPMITGMLQILMVLLFSFLFYRSLNKKIEKESQRLAKKQSTLFANIAHDLKTPLTSITGFSKALNEDIVETEEIKEVTSIIHQKSVTANELLDLMFQYTKLNSADFHLNKQSCAVNLLLKETVAAYYDVIEKHQIDFTFDIPEEPVIREIDQLEMRRVFSNLLINACKHNPIKTTLAITMVNKGNKAEIIFADNGTEIPQKDRAQLFHPFVSENEAERSFQGSGLGLAIVKTIIDKHEFTIDLLDDDEYTKKFVLTV